MEDEQTPTPAPAQSSSGLDPKIAGLLAYLFGWISGLIIFLIEKDNKEVRFHGMQSILFNVAYAVIAIALSIISPILIAIFGAMSDSLALIIASLFGLIWAVVGIGFIVIWIMLMVKAYNQQMWKLPIIGDMAEKIASS